MNSVFCMTAFMLCGLSSVHTDTILKELSAQPKYSTFLGSLSNETRKDLGNGALMTVFVSTNEAVKKLLDTESTFSVSKTYFHNVAEHSVVDGNWTTALLVEKRSLKKGVYGHKLWFNQMLTSVYVNNAKIVFSIMTSNGQVHELDDVIFPMGTYGTLKRTIESYLVYSGLQSLVAISPEVGVLLDDKTAEFTVFSPNPKAVTDAMKEMNVTQVLHVIRRHMIPGHVIFTTMLIGYTAPLTTLEHGAKIQVKVMDNMVFVGSGGYWSAVESDDDDFPTSNGVIHVINGVLGVTAGANVYQVLGLLESIHFGTTLSKMSESSELKKDLMDTTKMYTLFSPYNTAWDNVSTCSLETSAIEKILKLHVLSEKLTAEDLATKTELMTVSGEKLTVKNQNGKVFLEFNNVEAEVTSTDNMASNGIIHVIDKVLMTDKPNPNRNLNLNPSSNRANLYSISLATAVISLVLILLLS